MATSSIFANIKITNPKDVEAFVDALEASSRDPKRTPTSRVSAPLSDLSKIRKMFAKGYNIR